MNTEYLIDWSEVQKIVERIDQLSHKRWKDKEDSKYTINTYIDCRGRLAVISIRTYIEDGQPRKQNIEFREGVDSEAIYLSTLEKSEDTGQYLESSREKLEEIELETHTKYEEDFQ